MKTPRLSARGGEEQSGAVRIDQVFLENRGQICDGF